MESDYLHLWWDEDLDPASGAAPTPLPLLDLPVAVVHETDAIDVALVVFSAYKQFYRADWFLRPDLIKFGVHGGAVHRVESLTLVAASKDHFELIEIGVGLDAEAAKLDTLAQVHGFQVRVVRPLEGATWGN